MKQMTKRFFCVLLSVLMLLSMGAVQLASAAAAVGRVETLKATTVSQSQIRLKWSKVKKADGYCVYSYDAKKDAWLAETYTTETTFTDKGLAPGTKYTYKVAAFVKNGTSRTFGKDSPK
ncbi:MAG: fibronectin type III domain-containing protein, partial [Clostridia bacterium]|nr:fibronectin type III domain-containing protein [Clostridia bacterium]